MNDKEKKFVMDMMDLEKKGFELLYKHKIAEKLKGSRISMTTQTFTDIWQNYYEQQGLNYTMALMFAVKSYCEGKTSDIENSLICQTITALIEKYMPNHPLIQEIRMTRLGVRVTNEDIHDLVGKFKQHFDMQ